MHSEKIYIPKNIYIKQKYSEKYISKNDVPDFSLIIIIDSIFLTFWNLDFLKGFLGPVETLINPMRSKKK